MATGAGVKYIAFPAISCGVYGLVAVFSNSCDCCYSHCVSFGCHVCHCYVLILCERHSEGYEFMTMFTFWKFMLVFLQST